MKSVSLFRSILSTFPRARYRSQCFSRCHAGKLKMCIKQLKCENGRRRNFALNRRERTAYRVSSVSDFIWCTKETLNFLLVFCTHIHVWSTMGWHARRAQNMSSVAILTTYAQSRWYSFFRRQRATIRTRPHITIVENEVALSCLTIDISANNIVMSSTRNQCMGSVCHFHRYTRIHTQTRHTTKRLILFVAVILGNRQRVMCAE